jgi:hypothetical protein
MSILSKVREGTFGGVGRVVPVLELAEQTGLSRLIGEPVDLPSTRVRSGAINPAGKLTRSSPQ